MLENESYPFQTQSRSFRFAHTRQVPALHFDDPRSWGVQRADQMEESSLPAARWTCQRKESAFGNVKRDIS